ncbi:MAG: LLM class flavin-dependent oxidoreductase, partial [Deinococcus-Thermus bacterium]|nr:LLM class flavin-dependent oxidoreductase [Deinococcota bacterium]
MDDPVDVGTTGAPADRAPFEIGLYTFVENTPDPATGEVRPDERRIADLLEEIETADRVGLDVVGIGEHHRAEYLASAPDVLLAAAGARTERIRLSSAVTVLSSDDPVRAF